MERFDPKKLHGNQNGNGRPAATRSPVGGKSSAPDRLGEQIGVGVAAEVLDTAIVPSSPPSGARALVSQFNHLYTALERELEAEVQVVERSITRTKPNYVLGITSAVAGEGKSTIALHLAIGAARDTGRRVGLVDLSLGKDDLRQRLSIPSEAGGGVVDVLEGTGTTLKPYLPKDCDDLVIFPAGRTPANAARAARSPRVAEVIQRARELCDIIILDLPAISSGNVAPLSRLTEGIAVVVRSGATPGHVINRALDQIGRERVLGVILNRLKSPVPRWLARRILWA